MAATYGETSSDGEPLPPDHDNPHVDDTNETFIEKVEHAAEHAIEEVKTIL